MTTPKQVVEIPIGQRVQCRRHGGWFWFVLLSVDFDRDVATVDLARPGEPSYPLEVQLVPKEHLRYHENATAL